MNNKNVLLVSIVAVVVLLAAGLGVYFLMKSANAPGSGTGVSTGDKVVYNFRGQIIGKDAGGFLARGLIMFLPNDSSRWMAQAVKFKISPDARIFKIEGNAQKTKLAGADLGTIKTGDLVKVKADGLSVSGPEAIATDILI